MEDTTNPQGSQPQQDQPQAGSPNPPPAPTTGQPAPAQPTQPTPPPAQQDGGSKNLGGIMEENVDISSLVQNAGNKDEQQAFISSVKVPEHPDTRFDEQKFIQLLATSISLTVSEKKNIINAIPQLSQFQIDELMKIFTEEQEKFTELEKKHQTQVAELEAQHKDSWQDVEAKAQEDESKKKEEEEQAALRAQLGLGGDTASDDSQAPAQG